MTNPPRETRLAILIDAENVNVRLVRQVLSRLESARVLTIKRAYGDWGRLQAAWKSTLIDCGIQAVHAPNYAPGKNSADMALAIDAMDLLHQQVNWFCLVSNDSDFTPLAHRLVGSGARVIGFGSGRASQAFVNACHRFVLLEPAKPETPEDLPNPATAHTLTSAALQSSTQIEPSSTDHLAQSLPPVPTEQNQAEQPQQPGQKQSEQKQTSQKQAEQKQTKQKQTKQTEQKQTKQKQAGQKSTGQNSTGQKASPKQSEDSKAPVKLTQAKLGEALQILFCSASTNNNWLNLSTFHSLIQKQYPGFSCKKMGYKGLIKLVEGVERFEIQQRQPNAQQPNQKIVEIRLKQP